MSDDVQVYEGKALTVYFDGKRCIHARQCVLGLPEVFIANADGPWIQPDNAEADEVRALARRCPSGAITYVTKDGTPEERPPKKNVITVLENGPLFFRGDLHIEGEEPRIRAVLCRCGASQRKPFCDGSHEEMGFAASGEPPAANEIPALTEQGPIAITAAKNGPLLVKGPTEVIRGGTGKPIRRAQSLAMCRCGASKNKPFCDGSHSAIGFEAD